MLKPRNVSTCVLCMCVAKQRIKNKTNVGCGDVKRCRDVLTSRSVYLHGSTMCANDTCIALSDLLLIMR